MTLCCPQKSICSIFAVSIIKNMISQILKNPVKLKKITEAAFKAIDLDNNGFLEKNELEDIMAGVAEDIGIERPSK